MAIHRWDVLEQSHVLELRLSFNIDTLFILTTARLGKWESEKNSIDGKPDGILESLSQGGKVFDWAKFAE